jgi:hypothetical protein
MGAPVPPEFALDRPSQPFKVSDVSLGLIPAWAQVVLARAPQLRWAVRPRRALLLVLLLAGCANPRPQFDPAEFRSPGIERSLQYWTANYSHQAINHFYVCATDLYRGELVEALVYWREGGRLLDYVEMPQGAEAQAWRLRPKVDREALHSDETISGHNHVVPHRVWVSWVKQCITDGKEYVVPLSQARAAFAKPKPPSPGDAASSPPTNAPASR